MHTLRIKSGPLLGVLSVFQQFCATPSCQGCRNTRLGLYTQLWEHSACLALGGCLSEHWIVHLVVFCMSPAKLLLWPLEGAFLCLSVPAVTLHSCLLDACISGYVWSCCQHISQHIIPNYNAAGKVSAFCCLTGAWHFPFQVA